MPPKRTATNASTLAGSLVPAASATKRKAGSINSDEDEAPPTKKAKPAARPKAAAKTGTTKAKSEPRAGKDPKTWFNKAVQETVKKVAALDKKVKAMNPNLGSISVEDYASLAAAQLKTASALAEVDQVLAFNFIMFLGDVAAPYMDISIKFSGYGDHEKDFAELDDAILPLIQSRDKPTVKLTELPKVPHRWSRKDADVGVFKTGRPNKQQWNEMQYQRIAWEENRREQRRDRRAECEDWVSVALNDMKKTGNYLGRYGVEGLFKKSIAKLEEIDAAR